ncbi:MAG: glycosyltransferase family 2 protein [Betaproteobacteria bacterium]|nr:glycosyltransferase family 2 protein [Betaproteobacteria bacterium]
MPSPNVTFVIATYKRVEALRATLRSLILQQHQDWTALVIGDCCGEETAEAIRSLGEPRIRYYNLPKRFGEQSGPNSFGLHMATGDFIGFLNHDDLLLQDHVTYALERIHAERADFFIGACANATQLKTGENNQVIPLFTEVLPKSRDLSTLVQEDPYLFDPSSFWLIRTPYAKAVGPWRAARELWRTPLRDWLMRSWRLGGRFVFGERVTGLRFWTQNLRKGAPLYSNATPEHEFMVEFLRAHSAEEVRQFIGWPSGNNWGQGNGAFVQNRDARRWCLASFLYRNLGIDPYTLKCRLLRRPRGALLESISRRRTNEGLQAVWDLQKAWMDPETHRIL